jgi:hypothetical protein
MPDRTLLWRQACRLQIFRGQPTQLPPQKIGEVPMILFSTHACGENRDNLLS